MTKKRFAFLILLFMVLVLIGIAIISSAEHRQGNATIVITFLLNISISLFGFVRSVNKCSFGFDMMFWLFGLFFFGFAPLLQYYSDTYAWNLKPTDEEILYNNLLIVLWYGFYLIGKKIKLRELRSDNMHCEVLTSYELDKTALKVLLCISMMITLFNIVFVGFNNLFVRGSNSFDEYGKSIALIVNHLFHNIVLFCAVFHIIEAKRDKISIRTIISVVCLLISCFPTGMARNMLASFYGGLMIVLFSKNRGKKFITIAIIAGLVLVFPAINLFRNYWILQNNDALTYIGNSIKSTYLSGDFDAYQMFISIRRWQEVDGFSFGGQLIGALLFFVPRSIWPSKPLGTGQMAIERLNQNDFSNVSAPLVSEGYINFGIVGIVIFAIVIGIIARRVDKKYWVSYDELSFIRVVFPFAMFQFFFLQRGDMMSCFAYLIAQIIVGWITWRFVVRNYKINKEKCDEIV